MFQIDDKNTIIPEERISILFHERLVLEALQTIKDLNKNDDISARQAIIMLEYKLLDYIIDMYGQEDVDSYDVLSGFGFKKTGLLEQYQEEYKTCFKKIPPNDKDISFIHNSILRQTKSYYLIHRSLSSFVEKHIISEKKGRGRGRPKIYQITLEGSQMVEQIKNRTISTKYPEKLMKKYLAIHPVSSPIPSNISADTVKLISAADAEMSNRKYDNALRLYNLAIVSSNKETGSFIPGLYYNKGACLSSMGMIDDAIECYRSALTIKQNFMEASLALGVLFNIRRQPEDALVYLKKEYELAPHDVRVLEPLLLVLASLNRNEEVGSLLLGNQRLIMDISKKVISTPLPVAQVYDSPMLGTQNVSSDRGTDLGKVHNRLRMNQMSEYKKGHVSKRRLFSRSTPSKDSEKMYCSAPVNSRNDYGMTSNLQNVDEMRNVVECQRHKEFVENMASLSYNVGIFLVERGECEQARKLLKITHDLLPNDSLTNYILTDINQGQTTI